MNIARLLLFGMISLVTAVRADGPNPELSLFGPIVMPSADGVGAFPLVAKGRAADFLVDEADHPGVLRALRDVQTDIARVTGVTPSRAAAPEAGKSLVVVGTLGRSKWLDALVAAGKVDASPLRGKWESFVLETVNDPWPGVKQALVIAGSDKRGAIYGLYEVSRQIGVSPWSWWADVPVSQQAELWFKPGVFSSGEPAVKYRGIFINDEAPALRRWAEEKFGGLTPAFYAKVFELLLRCRANYLWPAMWLPTSFNDDFAENPRLADEYGIVMSTSHHEPMMRAHHEWSRYGSGPWNYETNSERLLSFWRGGVERVRRFENVVTVGMRGDGDEAMNEGTAVPLLKRIIKDQRQILAEVWGRPAAEIPQVWALYKEVQDYYDKGMRVDDDILVLFSDDNWGNIRFLPRPGEKPHPGGYGMYYHVDYVGAPYSYRWLNVSQIERIWEQMSLSYAAGVKGLWILNVGDIKPMELPMSFFLDLAWKPEAIRQEDLPRYYEAWAAQQFGPVHASEIAALLARSTQLAARRTPEMLDGSTYSVANYREADRVVAEYTELQAKSRALDEALRPDQRDAYFQLVRFPLEAMATVTEMMVAAGKNHFYAERGAAAANFYAGEVARLFARDAELTKQFHEQVSGGKWNHMMSQTHLGYTFWNHPPLNRMPAITTVQVPPEAELGFLVEHGERPKWGWLDVEADWEFDHQLPRLERVSDQDTFIDIINRGSARLAYTVQPKQPWILVSRSAGTVQWHEKVSVKIDWNRVPEGESRGEIVLSGAGKTYVVTVPLRNERVPAAGYVEAGGVISFDATGFSRETPAPDARWAPIPNLGRTGSGVTVLPALATRRADLKGGPCLEYDFTLVDPASVTLHTYLSPTQDFRKDGGLRLAVAIDGEEPQIINLNAGEELPDWKYAEWWMKSVGDHIKVRQTHHAALAKGTHTLKMWMVDSGIVVQKFVLDAGGLKPSYLGPPPSPYHGPRKN